MANLLDLLKDDYPKIRFVEGDQYSWSPKENAVIYPRTGAKNAHSNPWSLLHELSHAILEHQSYGSDIELVQLESKAWEKAVSLGKKYGYTIDPDYIEDCVDTYRDWLHQRSSCPNCDNQSVQQDSKTYSCFNCGQKWTVSSSRFCRPYRLKKQPSKKSPLKNRSSKSTFV